MQAVVAHKGGGGDWDRLEARVAQNEERLAILSTIIVAMGAAASVAAELHQAFVNLS